MRKQSLLDMIFIAILILIGFCLGRVTHTDIPKPVDTIYVPYTVNNLGDYLRIRNAYLTAKLDSLIIVPIDTTKYEWEVSD